MCVYQLLWALKSRTCFVYVPSSVIFQMFTRNKLHKIFACFRQREKTIKCEARLPIKSSEKWCFYAINKTGRAAAEKKSGDRHDNTQYKTELLCPAKCVLLSHSLRSIHLVCTIWIGADRQLDRSAKIKITQKKNPLPMSCFGYIFTRPIHRHVVHKNCVFHIADTHRQANILCERIQRAMRVKREWTRTCSAFNVKTEKKVLVMIIVSNYISIIMAQKHIEWNTQFMSD